MKHINSAKCNCKDCIWIRIKENSGIQLYTKTRKSVSYSVVGSTVEWINQEGTQNNLRNQSKEQILKCIEFRRKEELPSDYPQGAQSYKWALLNSPKIWID